MVVFLFGGSKIPQFARALGQARKEFDNGWKGMADQATPAATTNLNAAAPISSPQTDRANAEVDPLISAARNEGIITQGKIREQLAEELS